MTNPRWSEVDAYLVDQLHTPDPVLVETQASAEAAGLPPYAVAPNQGKFLNLLARFGRVKTILELGTLGGYSTIWLGRALPPDGRLVTIEADPRHAEVAKANIAAAGLADLVEVRVGLALEVLPQLTGPFDFIFLDADKANADQYFQWAMRLAHPGTLIVADNVVRQGKVADARTADESALGVRRMHESIAAEPRADATALQTVGVKGYDGFTVVLVTE